MKENKARSLARKSEQLAKAKERKSKTIDSRKVHDAKGKNVHGRTYR